MANKSYFKISFLLLVILSDIYISFGQEISILNYSTNATDQVLLEVNSTSNHYYILKVKHSIDSSFDTPASMFLGNSGTTKISEPLGKYPLSHYKVLEHLIDAPFDTDGDGIDDIMEYKNIPNQSPLNAASSINFEDGTVAINNFETFEALSLKKDFVQWSEFLNNKTFVKFIIDFSINQLYFIHTSNHNLHEDFAKAIDIDFIGDQIAKGQIIYHPTSISNSGALGTYAFNYSNGKPKDFDVVQNTHEFLAANMPFLENNLSYFVTEMSRDKYEQDKFQFQNSRVSVLLEEDVYNGIDYWGLNQTEGFGFFRRMTLEEIPNPKDIVLYETLPNSLPRVAGIMTSVIQTPLSHVNIRAIQNNIPNAFIRNPLSIDSISNLLDQYVYYKVEEENYILREATLEEVNNWFDDIRPEQEQNPPLNLEYKSILSLHEIDFKMYDGFGAKCSNIATMHNFNFPENTIPNGYGVPFFFYQEFIKHNNFFEVINSMLDNSKFIVDRSIRDEMLKDLRKRIKEADMPDWMMSELTKMHSSFPEGTSIRCRSSSNNEDLPGFNGAGLYDSKTQHPDEGHISKSIKQVYASLWNLRAFEEREFHRINHFVASMGVLCHPNYSNEKANGVGVSTDPLYETNNTFYLNTQLGEDLITNPDSNSIPEEILLEQIPSNENGYQVLQYSNLVADNTTIMSEENLDKMRDYLTIIHNEFEHLYKAENNKNFAMDIEYKITAKNQLIIKQARPWVYYTLTKDTLFNDEDIDLMVSPNPAQKDITVQCSNCELYALTIINIWGETFFDKAISNLDDAKINLTIEGWPAGIYLLYGFTKNDFIPYTKKFIKINN